MIINIDEKSTGQRLDKFLSLQLKNLSRSQWQKLIKQSAITVNGLPVAPHYQLKTNDQIIIKEKSCEQDKKAKTKKTKKSPAIKIIDETDEFLVINKPAGLAVHGSSAYTLADWLIEKYPGIKRVGDDPERPGIAHRLDKDVSGLMVIAKTQAAFANLKKQFQKRSVIKEYTALVYGKIIKDGAVINFPIKRARAGYKMAALPATVKGQPAESGRPAETEFKVLQRLINYTLIKIKIRTGRTHQIRVHLAAYDHPIVGDNIYGTAKTRAQNKKLDLDRIFLIADRLSFAGSANHKHSYRINLTGELKNILKIIK